MISSGQVITPGARIVPMIGHPIAQVITPEPMNNYFVSAGIEAAIVPMDVAPEVTTDFFRMVRGWNNCAGVSITMPHKQAAFTNSDHVSERAIQAQAVNLMVRARDGSLHGDMTDGAAFVEALRAKGFEPQGKRFILIGAGGAGAAVAHAMADAGVAAIHIIDIDSKRSRTLRDGLMQFHTGLCVPDTPVDPQAIDIVFNATPLGMKADDPPPFDLTILSQRCFVADAVTKPLITPFVATARSRGMATLTGEEMALAQLPIQLPLWGFEFNASLAAGNRS